MGIYKLKCDARCGWGGGGGGWQESSVKKGWGSGEGGWLAEAYG